MYSILLILFYAVLLFALYKSYLYILKIRNQTAQALKWGCKHPPTLPFVDPFGIQMARDTIEANANKRMPEWSLELIEKMSAVSGRPVLTFYLKFPPGWKEIFTIDPRNIQTVLAGKFKDFELPAARVGNFEPLLGKGIVCLSLLNLLALLCEKGDADIHH
jgi:hypothetical protein